MRNNFIYRDSSVAGDVAIGVFDSPNTQVLHNSILLSGTYASPIEYRFADTTGVVVANNLLDGAVRARDGAVATVTGNVTTASAALFASPSTGDLHLKSTATVAIDKAAPLSNVPGDWDGDTRPQGASADVGADEYRSTTTTAPRPPTNVRITSS